MIEGFIDRYRQAKVSRQVAGLHERRMEAVIDTGFDGDLCLPVSVAIELGLALRAVMKVELADGTIKQELVFAGQVKLAERNEKVRIVLTEANEALLGTNLISYLEIDFEGGQVRLEPKAGD
jgi:clan AA aspartic protease